MKLTILTFLIGILQSFAISSYSQVTKLNLKMENNTVKEVLAQVEEQSEFYFLYNSKLVDVERKVDVSGKDLSITDVLNHLFANSGVSYNIVDRQIVLSNTKMPVALPAMQQGTVTGKVTDRTGSPLPGATVVIKGTVNGTITDNDGTYALMGVPPGSTLVYSFIGNRTQEVSVENKTEINVTLEEDIIGLEEVVAIGYGTMRKSDLTGSVARVNAEMFESQSVTQLNEMLSGTIAGFNSNQGTSASGGGSLEIRGPTSLNANTAPLVVLDGVIYNGALSDIAPNDIESIDILKDASSAAVFGSRAASGVILVTTKRGTTGKPVVNFSTELGMAQVVNPNDIRPLNAKEYPDFRRDLLITENPGRNPYYYFNPDELPDDISIEQWLSFTSNPNSDVTREWLNRLLFFPEEVESYLAGESFDWYDMVMQRGLRQNYDLSINGGSEQMKYYWSLGYTDNEGVVTGDEYSTVRTRLNLNSKINDFLDFGMNSQFSSRDNSSVSANLGQMFSSSPFGNLYNADGTLKWWPNGYQGFTNPLMNTLLQDRLARVNTFFSIIYSELSLPYGFSFKVSYQPRFTFSNTYNYWPTTTPTGGNSRSGGYGTRTDAKTYEWMVDNLIKWNKQFGRHKFDMTLLYNLEKFQSWSSFQSGETFVPNEKLSFNALQFATQYALTNNDQYSTGDALMARLNYTLNEKYFLTLSFRRDGYSAFGQGNPRANFPAAAFAWNISDEDFFNKDFFYHLKLRLSWGVNGNREIGRYAALAQLNQTLYSTGNTVLVGVFNSSLSNPNLAWERTEAFNVGLNFGIFEGRLNGDIDLYEMTTTNLLMNRNLPQITGFNDITTNLGELQNRGFELTLNTVNIDNSNLKWKSNLVFSFNRNKIKSLFGDYEEVEVDGKIIRREVSDIANQWFIGQALDRIWDYEITGVWQTEEAAEAAVYALKPGDYKAVDVNEDGVYSALDDKQFIGWRNPRFRVGLRNDLTIFRNLTASVFLRSDLGHLGSINAFRHTSSNVYDRRGMMKVPYWTALNPSDKYGKLTANNSSYGGGYQIYFDRSYLRVQDVSLSYNIPKSVYQQMHLQKLRIYVSIRNLLSISKWEFWDPESGGSPMPRIFTLGIDMSL